MQTKNDLNTRKFLALILELTGTLFILATLSFDFLLKPRSNLDFGKAQIVVLLIGIMLIALNGLVYRPRSLGEALQVSKTPSTLMFIAGLVLLVVNLIGLLIPLRNPQVYQNHPFAGQDRSVQYTAAEAIARMNRDVEHNEGTPEYLKRLTQLIYANTIHYWEDSEDNAYNLEVPFYENYLLYLMNRIKGGDQKYEFCSAEKAIERAASVCSQSSKILADILTNNGIRANIVALDGHVVLRARVDNASNEWWVLDGDYGVVLEHDFKYLAEKPELVRETYGEAGYPPSILEKLTPIYAPEGNKVITKSLVCNREDNLYLLKWLIPLALVIPLLLSLVVYQIKKPKIPT
jgi:hypothetical protein